MGSEGILYELFFLPAFCAADRFLRKVVYEISEFAAFSIGNFVFRRL